MLGRVKNYSSIAKQSTKLFKQNKNILSSRFYAKEVTKTVQKDPLLEEYLNEAMSIQTEEDPLIRYDDDILYYLTEAQFESLLKQIQENGEVNTYQSYLLTENYKALRAKKKTK